MFAAFALAAALAAATNAYAPESLVTTSSDASLVNGWGLSAGPTTPWWVSDNGTDKSTLYSGTGSKVALTVSVPGGPTGTVFNGDATAFAGSRFLFSNEAGQILGWAPGATAATVKASAPNASFKGLTILSGRLYATDFHNGKVVVFDSSFDPVPASFADKQIPKGYAPFGIQALGGNIVVTYALQDAQKKDEVDKPGKGYVAEFTPDGQLVANIVKQGGKNAPPNAPWGLAMAPATGFGAFSGDLLVGNFGNGRISAYTQLNGRWVYKGQLRKGDGTIAVVPGLWAIAFGNGSAAGPTTSLYYAAGPNDEQGGDFGVITSIG